MNEEAKLELGEIIHLRRSLDDITDRLVKLNASLLYRGVSYEERVQGGKGFNLSNIIVKIDRLEDKYNLIFAETLEKIRLIECRLELVGRDNPFYATILRWRYEDGLTIEVICVRASYSYSHMKRLMELALSSYTEKMIHNEP